MRNNRNKQNGIKIFLINLFSAILFCNATLFAQKDIDIQKDSLPAGKTASFEKYKDSLKHQRDIIDIILLILHKNLGTRVDSAVNVSGKLHISAAPGLQYTEQTGLAATVSGNAGFYFGDYHSTNISSVLAAVGYSQKQQFFAPIQSSIFTKNNNYFLFGDWRFLKFPQDTYGLGGHTTLDDGYLIDYDYVRFYQSVLKKWGKNFYAGLGFQYDNHWNIQEIGVAPDSTNYAKYGFSKSSISSGLTLNVLYDSRKNSINPEGGSMYGNIVFRQNFTFLGSDQSWNSVIIDLRKYITMPHGNVLAFWSYDWFVLSGNPPYLDLPNTEGDTYGNTGRGYVQSRFIGKKMIDLEAEYRFRIMRDGLIGGVVFANAESVSEVLSPYPIGSFQVIQPAIGAGLRLKFNKFSKTNICIDYAVGTNGNNGIFANLGEAF
jgi:hypothetical protein